MHVFVTGASGHLGSQLVPRLRAASHDVTGLARSDAAAATIRSMGARVHRGSLDDLDSLRTPLSGADAVVHLAFPHDLMATDYAGAAEKDRVAVSVLGEALAGSGKRFVGASGTLMAGGHGRVWTESDVVASGPRSDTENYIIGLAERGVRSSIVRISPATHSSTLDRNGFVRALIGFARESGVSAYVGDGSNRWSSAHTLDTVRLLRLALEQAPAGTRLHAAADEGITGRQIATAIGTHLDLPIVSIPHEEATAHFGFLAKPLGVDAPAASTLTRQILGWEPREVDLLTDLSDERYFDDAERDTSV